MLGPAICLVSDTALMARPPLNARQIEVLRWIADGSPPEVMTGNGHKNTARALESRRLATVSRRNGTWTAAVTDEGQHYLDHGRYRDPPVSPEEPERESSPATQRLLERQAKRVAAARPSTVPSARSTSARRAVATSTTKLEPLAMRYKIILSRVQTAERHVRAPSEEEALAKVQAELDKPYGFLGGWTTIDTDMDIVEAANPLDHPPQQIVDKDGGFLLTIKAAAKYLGLSYSTLYEMLNRGEIAHVVVGTRRYISRDQMTAFIDGHTHTGGDYGLRHR